MDELERELKTALRPVAPPSGFTGRVLARARMTSVAARRRPRMPAFAWGVTVAVLAAVATGGLATYRSYEHRRGEQARAEVVLALQITGSKLRAVQAQITNAGPRQGGDQ